MTELSDELLVAYVDGQLARKQTRAVEKVLGQDDVIARRVSALKNAHSRLEAAFEAILAGEEAEVSAKPGTERTGVFIEWRIARIALAGAGIAASLVLAVAGYGWPLTLPESLTGPSKQAELRVPGWEEAVARAQALLTRASLDVGLDSQRNRDFAAFQLALAIGQTLKLPDLAPQRFRFVRAQILRFEEAPLAQVLYLGPSGPPVALYVKKSDGAGRPEPAFTSHGAIGAVTWFEDGLAYLLAGEEDEGALVRLAEKIRHEPPPAAPPVPRANAPAYSPLPKPL